ncbi:MAG: hypothetical protein AAB530_01505 [Patescibacteria group bacterium]
MIKEINPEKMEEAWLKRLSTTKEDHERLAKGIEEIRPAVEKGIEEIRAWKERSGDDYLDPETRQMIIFDK